MSLKIWLPLNGNLNNQGLSDITVTNSGATVDNNGKIGKCYSFDGSNDAISIPFTECVTNDFSICMWFYKTQLSSKSYDTIFGGPSGFEIETRNASETNPVIVGWNWGKPTFSYTFNEWHHLVMTRTSSATKWYLDGELKATGTAGTIPSGNYYIGSWRDTTSQNYLGKINDFRVYDHALSAKEVKEISKGLVLHYKLDNPMETNIRNLYNAPYCYGSQSATLNSDGSYKVANSYTGNGGDSWFGLTYPAFSFTAGKTYMWSCKIRCNSCTSNISVFMRTARMSNDWETSVATIAHTNLADGQWHEYVYYRTLQAKSTRNGTEYNTSPRLEFYSGTRKNSGEVYAFDFDIKDVMVCETSTYVPFIDNNMCENIISDCSGYGNNGELIDCSIHSESPRYNISYINTTNTLLKSNINMPISKGITFSFWCYIDTLGMQQSGLFATSSNSSLISPSDYNTTTMHHRDGGFDIRGTNSTGYRLTCVPTINKWTMYTVSHDGSIAKYYENGVLKNSANIPTSLVAFNSLYIGYSQAGGVNRRTFGKWSDFRIYATALSSDDIKELYQTSTSIDKDGNLYAYSLVEE